MMALLAALAGGLLLDWAFGDPPNRYHPVAWLGRIIGFFVPRLKGGSAASERAKGIAFAIAIVAGAGVAAHLAATASLFVAGIIGLAIFSAIILKVTVAVR